jgi:hypothetical protein
VIDMILHAFFQPFDGSLDNVTMKRMCYSSCAMSVLLAFSNACRRQIAFDIFAPLSAFRIWHLRATVRREAHESF